MRTTVFISLILMTACYPGFTPQKKLQCVERLVVWNPKEWNGKSLDTNSNVASGEYYHKISNVSKVNSPKNEYQLSHLKGGDSYITYGTSDFKEQSINKVLITESDLIQPLSKLEVSPAPTGFLSQSKKEVYFASIPNYLNDEKISEYKAKPINNYKYLRIPTSDMIGRSRIFRGSISNNKINNISLANKSEGITEYDWESHPAVSPNGEVLFFASTRDGGFGGIDIWYSKINPDGSMGEPRNAGSKINTPLDEVSPFVDSDNSTLYFSSNGWDRVGGFDIHSAKIEDAFWKENNVSHLVERANVGFPINTKANELFPNTDNSFDKRFYYASDQDGGEGKFDIWVYHELQKDELLLSSRNDKSFEEKDLEIDVEENYNEDIPKLDIATEKEKANTENKKNTTLDKEEIKVEIEEKVEATSTSDLNNIPEPEIEEDFTGEILISGKVTDEKLNPIADADIKITELPSGKVQDSTKSNSLGEYSIKAKKGKDLVITTEGEDYFYESYDLPIENQKGIDNIKSDVKLNTLLTLRINFPYNVFDDPYEYVIDEKGNDTKKAWHNELNKIADNIKKSLDELEKVELIGHTDPVGSNTYNKTLGLNRVIFVVSELQKRGIPIEIMQYSSVGESEPLVQYNNEPIEKYHKRLRRVSLEKTFKK